MQIILIYKISYVYPGLARSGHSSEPFSVSFLCVCHLAVPPCPSALVCSILACLYWPAPMLEAVALEGVAEASYHVNKNVRHFT